MHRHWVRHYYAKSQTQYVAIASSFYLWKFEAQREEGT